jgi:hypothetical protein
LYSPITLPTFFCALLIAFIGFPHWFVNTRIMQP